MSEAINSGNPSYGSYTLLNLTYGDESLNPPARLLMFNGCPFPESFYSIEPRIKPDGSAGPFFYPSFLWSENESLCAQIMHQAAIMRFVPIFTDDILSKDKQIKLIKNEPICIPHFSAENQFSSYKAKLRCLTKTLTLQCDNDYEEPFNALVDCLKELHGTGDYETKAQLCLLEFPYRLWHEGPFRQRIHPAIIVQTEVLSRYYAK